MSSAHQVGISHAGHVATVSFERPPHNFVDPDLIRDIADALLALDGDANCRAIVLTGIGRNFCAGANFGRIGERIGSFDPVDLYQHAMRLFDVRKPIVAAVQGKAVGAGAGLALAADFRVVCAESRFSFSFNRLGVHPGFGLSCTLPRLIGEQRAALLFFTGRPIGGQEALAIGLADELAPCGTVLGRAQALAAEIGVSSPDAVQSTRASLRLGFTEQVRQANRRELVEQQRQFKLIDFREGVQAMAQGRLPVFQGR